MIPSFRRAYNESFSAQKYDLYKRRLEERAGMEIPFRLAESARRGVSLDAALNDLDGVALVGARILDLERTGVLQVLTWCRRTILGHAALSLGVHAGASCARRVFDVSRHA